jgi:hypothetical protein
MFETEAHGIEVKNATLNGDQLQNSPLLWHEKHIRQGGTMDADQYLRRSHKSDLLLEAQILHLDN